MPWKAIYNHQISFLSAQDDAKLKNWGRKVTTSVKIFSFTNWWQFQVWTLEGQLPTSAENNGQSGETGPSMKALKHGKDTCENNPLILKQRFFGTKHVISQSGLGKCIVNLQPKKANLFSSSNKFFRWAMMKKGVRALGEIFQRLSLSCISWFLFSLTYLLQEICVCNQIQGFR